LIARPSPVRARAAASFSAASRPTYAIDREPFDSVVLLDVFADPRRSLVGRR
jgi:hypothetical protein